ncbi:MAG: hypothetical protein IJF71_05635, partial [Clostridia bacterium]|nr:hypothetical protein [Clostridia bacterium]
MKKIHIVLISIATAVVLAIGSVAFWYFDSGVRPLTARREKKIIEAMIDLSDGYRTFENTEIETYLGSYMGADVFMLKGDYYFLTVIKNYEYRGFSIEDMYGFPHIRVYKGGKLYLFELLAEANSPMLQKRHVEKIAKIFYEKYIHTNEEGSG